MTSTHATQTPRLLDELNKSQQRIQHLQAANRIRTRRAEIRRGMHTGQIRLADIIADDAVQSMPIADLIMFTRRWGTDKTRQLLSSMRISEQREIRMLTQRQRNLLSTEVH